MPDQPADPIHYEMKIPPEPKQSDKEEQHDRREGEEESPGPVDSKDAGKTQDQDVPDRR